MRTKLVLEQLAPGERLHVIVDHEAATRNVPRSLREWGQQVENVRQIDNGAWEIVVLKRTDERT